MCFFRHQRIAGRGGDIDPAPRRARGLKVLSWNIAGWHAKKNNQQFLCYLKQFDIIFFQETWQNDPIFLNGYNCHYLPASPSLRGGRSSGGLACFISTELAHSLTALPSCNSLATAALLSFKRTTLLLVNVYIPPGQKKPAVKAIWAELEAFLEPFDSTYPSALTIVCGDFNASIGTDDNSLYTHFNLFMDPEEQTDIGATRLSKDRRSNFSGLCLVQAARRRELLILNGNIEGDRPGEYTHFSKAGGSVIDYILISRFAHSFVRKFQVGHNTLSDHLPLILELAGRPFDHSIAEPQYIPSVNLGIPAPKRLKWSPILNENLTLLLQSAELKLIRSTIVSGNSVDAIMERFKLLLERLKSHLTTVIHSAATKRAKDGASWFDLECRQTRSQMRTAYQRYRKSGTALLLNAYIYLRRFYKQLLRRKKLEAERAAWHSLVKASHEKDTTCFWRTISGLLGQERTNSICTVEPMEWLRHFQSLFYDQEVQHYKLCIQLEDLPHWPPVTVKEVENLIAQLKNNKAPGNDYIPAELLKSNIGWWAPLLASLFSWIDSTGLLPDGWTEAIVIPIYKKGPMPDPASYRPISLLPIPSKLYAKHLYIKLTSWLETEAILAEEQAGFRQGRSTIDHCFTLAYFIDKYAKKSRGVLYAAFIDLKAAFDSIPRARLWDKLSTSSIDKRLLFLISCLYKDTVLHVRTSSNGHLIGPVPVCKGVKQGCILAPVLFNFYINDMVNCLSSPDFHAPKLADKSISVLLYADDAILLSRTRIGLNRLIGEFSAYCRREQLVINYQKTKIMVFARKHRQYSWRMDNQTIEQVKAFKYLGIVFQSTGSWDVHQKCAKEKAAQSIKMLSRFFYTKGGRYIPAALEVFQAKPLAQLLYGAQIWTGNHCSSLETVQSKFLRQIFGVPSCVPNAALRLEACLPSVETQTWQRTFNYWLRLNLNPPGLLPLVMQDPYKSKWFKTVHQKLLTCGLHSQSLLSMGLIKAKSLIGQRLKDIERQNNLTILKKLCPWYTYFPPSHFDSPASYLFKLTIPKYRRAFTLARWDVLPSAVLEGRYQKTPFEKRLCPCGDGNTETMSHVLLSCPLYKDLRNEIITPLILANPGRSPDITLYFLLSDTDSQITEKVARYIERAMKLRATI